MHNATKNGNRPKGARRRRGWLEKRKARIRQKKRKAAVLPVG